MHLYCKAVEHAIIEIKKGESDKENVYRSK